MSQQCHLITWCFSSFYYYQQGKPYVGCMRLHALFFPFVHTIYLGHGIAVSNWYVRAVTWQLLPRQVQRSLDWSALAWAMSHHADISRRGTQWVHLNVLIMPPVYLAWHIQVTKFALGFWWRCSEVANALAIFCVLTAINRAARTTATAACLQASTCHQAQKPF